MPWITENQAQWVNSEEEAIGNALKTFNGKVYEAIRELRPSDLVSANNSTITGAISPTVPTLADYHLTIAPTTTVTITFSLTAKAVAFYGWYCNTDLGVTGYIQVQVDNVVRQEVPAETPYNQTANKVYLVDQTVFVPEGSSVTIKIYNGAATTASGVIWPLAWIAGTASALGIAKA
jgi:hypothetical protein